MKIHSPKFDLVTSALAASLHNLPPKIIAVTGPFHAGKTTLSRYLAWYFNISLIETDLFIISSEPVKHHLEEICRIIQFRLSMNRPVLVDGATVLDLLQQCSLRPDHIVKLSRQLNLNLSDPFQNLDVITSHFEDIPTVELVTCN